MKHSFFCYLQYIPVKGERKRERERETERQRDRETERDRNRKKEREKERKKERETHIDMGGGLLFVKIVSQLRKLISPVLSTCRQIYRTE